MHSPVQVVVGLWSSDRGPWYSVRGLHPVSGPSDLHFTYCSLVHFMYRCVLFALCSPTIPSGRSITK